ncbi:hypothetical protein RhiirA4_465949 [Rhizophagus irregularis]|uniref:MACPF domain-containing protein n=1 Tax=Rhizophagus irregularis TaxID=588596 RepID=A0A2I1GT51_9GLOM|nr:hypothetical protein RhiirA4_465949 [Rhizophagus irregularis]
MVNIHSKGFQNEIIDGDSINVQDNIKITVQIDNPPSKLVLVNLNPKDKLSKIREKLEQNSKVKMNDALTFAYKISQNNNTGGSLAEIAREDEEKIILEKIMDKKSNFIFLKSEPEPDWRILNDKLKLEYGRTETLKKANNKAFTIVDCEMNEIVDGYKNSTIQIDLEEDKIIKNDFLLIADIDIPNFAKLGVLFENSNTKNSNVIASSTYNIIEYKKMSLKLKLEPTKEFIEAIKDVIDSKDPRKFKDIINDFGQYISKEVILGGRAYFAARENSEENSGKYAKNTDCQASNIKVEKKSSKTLNKNNSSKYQSFKIFGGKEICSNNFNETDWIESLRDFRNWSSIKFKDPVNIFQLLPENLRRQVLLLVGKKILYTNTEDCTYYLFESGMHHTFKLNIPENILKIIHHKDANCNIFATVIDKKEKNIFNCQVVWPPNEDPKLIIHCIQKKFRKRECKLKIRWMIIGYDMNFDFNHSDLNNHFVNLPNFTFYTLIISNYPNSDDYGILPFQHISKISKLLNFIKFNSLKSNPKFISLHSTKNKYGPIFLKQKTSEIKIKYINVNCDQDDCICKCNKLEDNLKYAFLDPKNQN